MHGASCHVYFISSPIYSYLQVFPIIRDSGFVSTDQHPQFRLVSKRWSVTIDKEIKEGNIFVFPLHPSIRTKLEKMKRHPRNPFVGPRVLIETPSNIDIDDENENWRLEFVNEVKNFLDCFGKYVIDLEIDVYEPLDINDLANVALYGLSVCKNIKRLAVDTSDVMVYGWLSDNLVKDWLPENFKMPKDLEELEIHNHTGLQCLQSLILEQGPDLRLKRFTLSAWSHECYSKLQWNFLVELNVESKDPWLWNVKTLKAYLSSLRTISMPNLTTIKVPMCKGKDFLESLLQTVSHFPKLTELELHFEHSGFHGFSNAEVVELGTISVPGSVNTLKLNCIHSNCFNDFGFILYFPFLKKIELSSYEVDRACKKFPARPNEIVELSRLLKEKNSLYKSNIWELMPLLEKLSWFHVGMIDSRDFTRHGYNWLKNEESERSQNIQNQQQNISEAVTPIIQERQADQRIPGEVLELQQVRPRRRLSHQQSLGGVMRRQRYSN